MANVGQIVGALRGFRIAVGWKPEPMVAEYMKGFDWLKAERRAAKRAEAEAAWQSQRITQGSLEVLSAIPAGFSMVDVQGILQDWAKGQGDVTELKTRIWNEKVKPYLYQRTTEELKDLGQAYSQWMIEKEVKPVAKITELRAIKERPSAYIPQIIRDTNFAVNLATKEIKAVVIEKTMKEIREKPGTIAPAGTNPEAVKNIILDESEYFKRTKEHRPEFVEFVKRNPRLEERLKELEKQEGKAAEQAVALQYEILPEGLRILKLKFAAMDAGKSEKEAEKLAKEFAWKRRVALVGAKDRAETSWQESLRQGRADVEFGAMARVTEETERRKEAAYLKEVWGVERSVQGTKKALSAATMSEDLSLMLQSLVHEHLGVSWPVAGSKEATREMESLKRSQEWLTQELIAEERRTEAWQQVASPGFWSRAMDLLGGAAGILNIPAELTEHLVFAASEAERMNQKTGYKWGGSVVFNFYEAWKRSAGKTWSKNASDDVLFPGFLVGAFLESLYENVEMSRAERVGRRDLAKDYTDLWTRIAKKLENEKWKKNARASYIEDLYQFTADVSWWFPSVSPLVKGMAAGKVSLTATRASLLATSFAEKIRPFFPVGADAFEVAIRGAKRTKGFFEIPPSYQKKAMELMEGLQADGVKLKGMAKSFEAKAFKKTKDIDNLYSALAALHREGAEGVGGRTLLHSTTRAAEKIEKFERWALLQAMEALKIIPEHKIQKFLDHRSAKGAIAWAKETGGKLRPGVERLLSKDPRMDTVNDTVEKLTKFGWRKGTPYQKGYFAKEMHKMQKDLLERGWRLRRAIDEPAFVRSKKEAIALLADTMTREVRADMAEEMLKKFPELSSLDFLRQVDRVIQAGKRLPPKMEERWLDVWAKIYEKKLTREIFAAENTKELMKLSAKAARQAERVRTIHWVMEGLAAKQEPIRYFKWVPAEIRARLSRGLAAYDAGLSTWKKMITVGAPRWYIDQIREGIVKGLFEGMEPKAYFRTVFLRAPKSMKGITGEILDFKAAFKKIAEATEIEMRRGIGAKRPISIIYVSARKRRALAKISMRAKRMQDDLADILRKIAKEKDPTKQIVLRKREKTLRDFLDEAWKKKTKAEEAVEKATYEVRIGLAERKLRISPKAEAELKRLEVRVKRTKESLKALRKAGEPTVEAEKSLENLLSRSVKVAEAAKPRGLVERVYDFAELIIDSQRQNMGKWVYDKEIPKLLKKYDRQVAHRIAYQRAQDFVEKVYFDYTALSDFDKMMRRIDPFWVYHSRRFCYYLDLGLRKPYLPIKTSVLWRKWEENSVDKRGGIQVGGWVVPTRPWLEFRHFLADIDKGQYRDPEKDTSLDWFVTLAAHLGFSFFTPYEWILSHPSIDQISDRSWKDVNPFGFITELFFPGWKEKILDAMGFKAEKTREQKMDRLVKKEIARQIVRGETANVKKAREVAERQVFLTQFFSWAIGANPKYRPKEDIKLASLQREYLRLPLRMRGSFVKSHPEIRAYWAINDVDEKGKPLKISAFVGKAYGIEPIEVPFLKEGKELERLNKKYERELKRLEPILWNPSLIALERAYRELPTKQREAFLDQNPSLRVYLEAKASYREIQGRKQKEISSFLSKNPSFREQLEKFRISPTFYAKYQKAKDIRFWSQAPDPVEDYEAWASYVKGTPYWTTDNERGYQRYLVGKAKWAFWSNAPDPKTNYLGWVAYVRGTSFWTSRFETGFQRYLAGQRKFAKYLAWQPYWDLIAQGKKKEARAWFNANQDRLAKGGFLSTSGDPALDRIIVLNTEFWSLTKSERGAFLEAHPDLLWWWRKEDTPDETKLRQLIDKYFQLPKAERVEFLKKHPEVVAYWEERKRLMRTKTMEEHPEIAPLMAEYKIGIEEKKKILARLKEGKRWVVRMRP